MSALTYPLATQGIFATIQGEGALLGVPMTFVRLAGCSVGCPQCDTNYRITERLSVTAIAERVLALGNTWTWVTGGEPADYDLWPLLESLRLCGKIALATSGHKPLGAWGRLVDFLSVSPHDAAQCVLWRGSQVNLVPGLNGLRLADFISKVEDMEHGFASHYVTPLSGSAESLQECLQWVKQHSRWRVGIQAHKAWGLP